MQKFLAIFILSSFSSLAKAQFQTYVPLATTMAKKTFQFQLKGSRFFTEGYYDFYGDKVAMGASDSFTQSELEATLNYGLNDQFEAVFGGRARDNESQLVVNDFSYNIGKAGMESVLAGARYSFPKVKALEYTLEFFYRNFIYSNAPYDSAAPYDSLILGDGGGSELSGGLVVSVDPGFNDKERTTQFPNHSYSFRAHYVNSGRNLSNEVRYQAETNYTIPFFPRLAFVLGDLGVYSLETDPYTDNPTAKPAKSTGATRLYNGVNRSLNTLYGGINFSLSKAWRVEGRLGKVLQGVSTDQGVEYSAAIVFREPPPSSYQVFAREFKEYSIEGNVVKVSPREKFVVIDQGMVDDVEKGMRIDLYEFDYKGGNRLVATGVVIQLQADTAIVKILQKYNQSELKEGLVVRGGITKEELPVD